MRFNIFKKDESAPKRKLSRKARGATTIVVVSVLLTGGGIAVSQTGVFSNSSPINGVMAAQVSTMIDRAASVDVAASLNQALAPSLERIEKEREALVGDVSVALDNANQTLEAAGDQVMDASLVEALNAEVAAAPAVIEGREFAAMNTAVAGLNGLNAQVGESHVAWVAEQERIAAEKAEAERVAAEKLAAEKAAAEKAQRNAPKRDGGTQRSTEASSGASAEAPAPAPAAGNDMYVAQCPNTRVIPDADYLNGHWGTADWWNNTIGVKSGLPSGTHKSVLLHECAHIIQHQVFGADVQALSDRMNEIYGGSGYSGLDQNADCVALAWGASWTHYTKNCAGERGTAATAIINGQRP